MEVVWKQVGGIGTGFPRPFFGSNRVVLGASRQAGDRDIQSYIEIFGSNNTPTHPHICTEVACSPFHVLAVRKSCVLCCPFLVRP